MAILRKRHRPLSFAQRVRPCCVVYQIRPDLPGGVNKQVQPVRNNRPDDRPSTPGVSFGRR
eukprot:8629971-Pyramimonas_sp.AAC.1